VQVSVQLVYEGSERPYTAARVEDPVLARIVAQRAVDDAVAQAEAMSSLDPVLAEAQRAEAERLRRVLGVLVPRGIGSGNRSRFQLIEEDTKDPENGDES